ncbi:hypothetical protein ACJX0J_021930 [Zea mays]
MSVIVIDMMFITTLPCVAFCLNAPVAVMVILLFRMVILFILLLNNNIQMKLSIASLVFLMHGLLAVVNLVTSIAIWSFSMWDIINFWVEFCLFTYDTASVNASMLLIWTMKRAIKYHVNLSIYLFVFYMHAYLVEYMIHIQLDKGLGTAESSGSSEVIHVINALTAVIIIIIVNLLYL